MPKLQKNLIYCLNNFLVLALVLSLGGQAHAQHPVQPVTPTGAIPLEYAGTTGVWLPSDMAKQALQAVESAKQHSKQVELLELQLDVRKERILSLKDALELTKQSAAEQASVVEAAVRGRRQAEAARDSIWAGKPMIWLAAGVLLGVITTGVIVNETK